MNLTSLRKSHRLAPGWIGSDGANEAFVFTHPIRALRIEFQGLPGYWARRIFQSLSGSVDSHIGAVSDGCDLPKTIEDTIHTLCETGIIWPKSLEADLVSPIVGGEEALFSRNVAFWQYYAEKLVDVEDIHNSLQNSSVTLIGAGGFGSWLAYLLAGSGVGHLSLVDNDIVARSNLSRQVLYSESDVGALKVDAARARLLAAFPSLQVEVFPRRVTAASDLLDCVRDRSLVIAPIGLPRPGTQPPGLASATVEACSFNSVPLMFAGSGFVGPIFRKPSPSVFHSFLSGAQIRTVLASIPPFDGADGVRIQPAIACRLGITASLCAWEATRFLAGIKCYATDQLISIDTFHYSSIQVIG